MSDVEFLVKIRDGAQLIADACTQKLEALAPKETEGFKWDPSKISFKTANGARGPFEKADPTNIPDFKAMLADLKAHDGKLTRDGFFYWVFSSDMATVGRKKKQF